MITDIKINEEAKRRYYAAGYWTDKTLADVWRQQVERYGDKPYVIDDQGRSYTYRQCDEAASRLAAWMLEAGIQPGDVISYLFPTWAEFGPMYLAALKIGCVAHPLPRNFSTDDVVYAMNLVGSRAFVCPTHFHSTDHEQMALDCIERVDTLSAERVLLIDKNPAYRITSGLPCFYDVVAHHAPLAADDEPDVSSDSVACILATSGTTGRPKQALFTHNNILFSERTYIDGFHLTEDDVCFMPSPLNHATGFFHGLIATMICGGTVVLEQDFKADRAIGLINSYHCTWTHGATPFIFDILNSMDAYGTSVPSLKLFVCGGAPVPSHMMKRAWEHGILLPESYGSTESCPHAYVPPEHALEWDGKFSGIPNKGIEVRVVDANHNEVPRGVSGEEASRGPNVFVGYLNDPENTAKALDDDGWFYSGDLCVMDEEGRIKINGRIKDIIIRGGENISATEINDAVSTWPEIGEHAAVGMPDDRMGERICLFAVPADGLGHTPRLRDLKAYLADHQVSKRLWPERLEIVDEIPKTPTGKIQNNVLRDRIAKTIREERERGGQR
jgi:acyl-CoA synthetase